MIGNCLDGYVYMVASHATGQDDDKITFGVETFHHSKCWFFNMAVTNINDGNHILVETLVTKIKFSTNDVEEQFWIIVIQKREVPHVRSVILYKTIFKRWNGIKVSLTSECSNWNRSSTSHISCHILTYWEKNWLWHAPWSSHKGPCVKPPTCASEIDHLICRMFWALGSF